MVQFAIAAPKAASMMRLFVAFAGTAVMRAAIKTCQVISYSMAQRAFEMGMRVALRATRSSVFALVIGQSLRLVLTGLAVGVVEALALTRRLRSDWRNAVRGPNKR